MTSRRGTTRNSPNNNTNNETIPNSVARRTAQNMGSTFSSNRRSIARNTSQSTEAASSSNTTSNIYGTRYSRRPLNLRIRSSASSENSSSRVSRRQTTANAGQLVRDPSEQTPGPRRSSRISSRLIERRTSALPTPPPLPRHPPPGDAMSADMMSVTSNPLTASIRAPSTRPSSSNDMSDMEEGWQWREFVSPAPTRRELVSPEQPNSSQAVLPPIHTHAQTHAQTHAHTISNSATNSARQDHVPEPDNDSQSVEIVRVVPHRLIEIPHDEPFEPRPPPRSRPSSSRLGSGVLRHARRLRRELFPGDHAGTTPAPPVVPASPDEDPDRTPTLPRRRFQEIRLERLASHLDHGPNTDEELRGALLERAEEEALGSMINSTSVTANERLSRLRLLRLRQDSDATPRERLITGLLRRREVGGEASGENATDAEGGSMSPLPTRLRMLEIPGQGAIFMEDIRPETSLRMSLVQAQYLQEVLLRISSLLDNLHILSQMNERIEGPSADDPRLRTILAFATLDPDNMTYEQLLMLDELLPKNQGATKELIATKTSLLQYTKTDAHENDNCIICITDFEENDGIRLLPCCHIYHFACVDNWLKRKKTCPMCRSSIEDKPSKVYTERMERFRDFKK